MTSPNPIPEAIPSLPPYRPIRLIQPVVAVAYASLVIQLLRKARTRLNLNISPRELEDRTRFLLVRFRIHINRRYENSQKSGHLLSAFALHFSLAPSHSWMHKLLRASSDAVASRKTIPTLTVPSRHCTLHSALASFCLLRACSITCKT